VSTLHDLYYDIRKGIGFNKTPEEYGAFPSDPYSHTPGDGGARQPGMTGQVKEDILARFGELGVFVDNGCIQFNPVLLHREEFLKEGKSIAYLDIEGVTKTLDLSSDSLAFTYCQVPVVYQLGGEDGIEISLANGEKEKIGGNMLSQSWSNELFKRTGRVARIDVGISSLDR
jgi:hypothetical protein